MSVLDEVQAERDRQDAKWGVQNHLDGTGREFDKEHADVLRKRCDTAFAAGRGTWRLILEEEIAEAFAEVDAEKLRVELIQCAAVCAAWVQAIDRR